MGNPDVNPGAYVYDPSYDLSTRSTMAGLTYQVLRGQSYSLNVYGVYSQSFNWQSGQTFFGQVLGPILGNTHEVGLKGDVFDRKVFVTVAAFDIKRQNVAYLWSPDSLPATNLEDLINPNNLKVGDPGYLSVVNGLNSERRTVNSNEQSRGLELTLQGRRTHGVQARATLAFTHVEAEPDFTVFKSYLDAAIARTAAANAPGGDRTMAESATNIANAQTILNSSTLTNHASGQRSAPYVASFVIDYEVPKIAGLRLGVNGVITPNYNVAIFNGVAYKGGAMFPVGGYGIYDRKIANHRCTFRVGLQNVWDPLNGNSEYRKTGATGFNNQTHLPNYIYRYIDPATYSGSVTVQF